MYRQNAWKPETPRKRKIELGVVIGLGIQIVLGIAIVLAPHLLGRSGGMLSGFSDDWPTWPPTIRGGTRPLSRCQYVDTVDFPPWSILRHRRVGMRHAEWSGDARTRGR